MTMPGTVSRAGAGVGVASSRGVASGLTSVAIPEVDDLYQLVEVLLAPAPAASVVIADALIRKDIRGLEIAMDDPFSCTAARPRATWEARLRTRRADIGPWRWHRPASARQGAPSPDTAACWSARRSRRSQRCLGGEPARPALASAGSADALLSTWVCSMTFTATGLSRTMCWARYTTPIPPRPIAETMR